MQAGTMVTSLQVLFGKGVRYSTVIDVGCADGHFFLMLLEAGLVPGATPLNIDANALYRLSLEEIQNVVGGHHRICAITDHEGDIELTMSEHPYWASMRPEADPYWERVNRLSTTKTKVPATTLDALGKELDLKPPFLLKLDVQGAEESVLRGAAKVLADTHVVICEADIADFQTINAALVERGFSLYDATQLERIGDGTLGWFYPIYINRALDFVRPKNFWSAANNSAVIRVQEDRRKSILQSNAETLRRIKARSSAVSNQPQQVPATSRNQLCPCGSGRRYKHCCGAHRA